MQKTNSIFTTDQRLSAIKMMKKGQAFKDVAKKFGCATSTLRYWQRRHDMLTALDKKIKALTTKSI